MTILYVLGHHGTIVPSAINIVTEKDFTLSTNDSDWLGNGAYFFENAPLRAWLWAKREAKKKESEPAVVEVEIYLGQCLDLLDVHWGHIVRAYHQEMARSYAARGKQLPPQIPPSVQTEPRETYLVEEMEPAHEEKRLGYNRLDRSVINFTVQRLFEGRPQTIIDSTRAAFSEGHPLYEMSFLYDRSHVQIAVLDIEKCIVGVPRILDSNELEERRSDINSDISRILAEP